MPEYKRFVAYIYLYDKGIRIKNIGFAKVNMREGSCRLEIRLRGVANGIQRSGKVYLFSRRQEKMLGTYIGEIRTVNGAGELTLQLEGQDIMGSGIAFSEMGGIVIEAGSEVAYATEWDDLGIQMKNFGVLEKEAENPEQPPFQESRPKEEKVTESLASVETETPNIQKKAAEGMPHPVQTAEDTIDPSAEEIPIAALSESNRPEVYLENGMEAEKCEEPEKIRASEYKTKQQQKEKHPEPDPVSWKQMVEQYHSFPAFQDDEVVECIKIQPRDLGKLPKKEWVLGNNSFMLHGYYNYKYLLMGKKNSEHKECIILGVPGVYHSQEKMMASMFGFPEFKPAKSVEVKQGVFGYWYRVVSWEV